MSQQTYDIVFAGGGAVACVTAGRLARADPSLKILIVERGPHTNRGATDSAIRQPARCFYNAYNHLNTEFIFGQPSGGLNGRKPLAGAGKCLGGGSSVNFMIYSRAAASDYDDWEKLGNPGWGSSQMIPLANKAETFEGEPTGAPNHGDSGPIKVSGGGYPTNIGAEFLEVAKAIDPSRPSGGDTGDFNADVYGRWNMYVDKKAGTRSDAAHGYIYSLESDNVTVLNDHYVVRVAMDGTRATGLELMNAFNKNRLFRVYASRLVVVTAGAFGSPAILERSGIGGRDVLQRLDIHQKINLPGVGENYNDHMFFNLPCVASQDADSMDPVFSGDQAAVEEKFCGEWSKNGCGMLSSNGFDAGIRIRPSEKDILEMGSDFKAFWDYIYAPAPDKALFHIGSLSGAPSIKAAPGDKYFTVYYMTDYSFGKGSVHTGSATDPTIPVEWICGYFEDPADLVAVRWAYKHTVEYARRMRFFRGAVSAFFPAFKTGSEAASVLAATEPVPYDAPNILYDEEDDLLIDQFNQVIARSSWHSLGTCAMKPREQGGVVDPRLNVYGTQNLKIADLSIAPLNVTANTYNTALMIGEKAALLIAEDLGISKSRHGVAYAAL